MKTSTLIKTDDLNYKNGFAQCACGWRKELGNGFNGYHISNCPQCTPELSTRIQEKVTTGTRGNYTVKHGRFVYFAISNGIHVQYSGQTYNTEFKSRA